MPLAYYPTYRVTAADPSLAAYWQHWLALPFWPCGPQWFLWQLLAFNVLAAGLQRFVPGLGRASCPAGRPRRRASGAVLSLSGRASPRWPTFRWRLPTRPWHGRTSGRFAFQPSRPLHYLVYFFAGMAVGAYGLDRGLLDAMGPGAALGGLARRGASPVSCSGPLPTSADFGGLAARRP